MNFWLWIKRGFQHHDQKANIQKAKLRKEAKMISFAQLLTQDSESNMNNSSSVIAPISIALSKALRPPLSLSDRRAPLHK